MGFVADRNINFSDQEIIRRILGGEKDFFEVILRRYNQRLFRIILSYLKSESDAKDALQETYIKAYLKLDQFRNQSSFSTWLIRIAINEALQLIRKKKNFPEHLGVKNKEPEPNHMTPERESIRRENKILLETALDHLPEKYQVVFILYEFEGLSQQAVAKSLNLSEANVKIRMHRARNMLKEEIFKLSHDSSIFEFGQELYGV